LRRRSLRDQVTVDVYTPEPFPMPTAGPVLGDALAGMLARRGIGFHPGQVIEQIDPQARELVLAGGSGQASTCCSAYRLIVHRRQRLPAASPESRGSCGLTRRPW